MALGADADLVFLVTSLNSPSVGSVITRSFSGGSTGSIRSQSPSVYSRLGPEWVSWRYCSTSSIDVSSTPYRSLSSKDLANMYGSAVEAALFLFCLFVFCAFRSEFSCERTMSLSWDSPCCSDGELLRYLRLSLFGLGVSLFAFSSSSPKSFLRYVIYQSGEGFEFPVHWSVLRGRCLDPHLTVFMMYCQMP